MDYFKKPIISFLVFIASVFLLFFFIAGSPGEKALNLLFGNANNSSHISQEDAKTIMEAAEDGVIILDVRPEKDYSAGHIPGAINIPLEYISEIICEELTNPDEIILVYGQNDEQSKQAISKLYELRYTHVYEFGGFDNWEGEVTTEVAKPEEEAVSLIPLRILFIGNSHTYYNEMPFLVKEIIDEQGFDCKVTMLAHPAWFLSQHVADPEVRFNIRHGEYDYVVLQEHAHPFGPVESFYDATMTLVSWIKDSGSTPVLFMTWSKESEEGLQQEMTSAYRAAAEEAGALLAPVGEEWWNYLKSNPDAGLFHTDGAHASKEGSGFAASIIADTILQDLSAKPEAEE